MPTTAGRSRGRQGVRSGTQGAVGEHLSKIMTALITGLVVIVFALVMTKPGQDIDAATQHFMLFYAGVFALIGLAASVGCRPGGDRPDRHDPGTPGDGPGRAPGRVLRRAGLPGHPHRDRDSRAASACNRCVHPLPVAVPDLLHRARHDRVGSHSANYRDQHLPQAVHRARQGMALAGYPLRLLPGVRVRGPARAARRPGGQAVRGLELRVRDRTDRAGRRGQVPGHLAALQGQGERTSPAPTGPLAGWGTRGRHHCAPRR